MIAKCPNNKCLSVLSVSNSRVIAANGVLVCPECKTSFRPPPLIAVCGNSACRHKIKYYDWKFKDPSKPYVVCPHCEKTNKVSFRPATFMVYKKDAPK